MTPHQPHSNMWVFFSYASFIAAVTMVVGGLMLAPLDLAMKGYFAMAVAMLIQACITLTKTMRDTHEASRLHNRLEDAKAEQLLMKMDRT